jgi:hypothetical protein
MTNIDVPLPQDYIGCMGYYLLFPQRTEFEMKKSNRNDPYNPYGFANYVTTNQYSPPILLTRPAPISPASFDRDFPVKRVAYTWFDQTHEILC